MTIENQNYQSDILEYAVNQHLNKLLPEDGENALNVIANQSSDLVWRIATDIYKESGHQIDFAFIKNILNLRIEPLQNKIAEKATIAEREKLERELKEEKQKKSQESEIFIRIKNIIVEQLEVETDEVKLDTLFEYLISESYNDYRNRMKIKNTWCSSSCSISDRELNIINLVMAIEEEFNIEILDEESESLLSGNISQLINFILQKI